MPRCAWVFVVLLCGCPRPVPTPVEPRPAPPPPIQIPPGCDLALSGDWEHQDDPSFRYHFEDDRADVTVWVYRVFPPIGVDAGSPIKPPGALPVVPDAGAADAGELLDAGPADPAHRHPLPADLLPTDGGAAPLAASVIHLRRTPAGFIGEAEILHLLPSGRECRATFATRVTACTPSTLTLSSATSTPVGEGCQTPSLPQPAAMLEHRLARTDAGAL
jgi:hypothetical protein